MVNALSVNIKYDECGLGAGHIIGLQARGGMPPFRYEWVNENGTVVGQAANATGLTEGRYRLTITDANGCAVQSEAYVIPNNWSQLDAPQAPAVFRSEEHTSELQSLMRTSYAVFCLKQKKTK